jgi:glycosyltransferase involved in cell wall biosynthesis
LLLRSLAHSRESIKTIIVGAGPQRENLETLAGELGLSDRVKFAGFVSEEELLNLYARCGAVFYAPLDEDYGYVTLEAFSSLKTVITTQDAGGVLEFVIDGRTGFVAKPEPVDLAVKIDQWFRSADRGAQLGKNGYDSIRDISWEHVISALTSLLGKQAGGDC